MRWLPEVDVIDLLIFFGLVLAFICALWWSDILTARFDHYMEPESVFDWADEDVL